MQLDKWENENMPKVKIDPPLVNFSSLRCLESKTLSLVVQNIGPVVAHFRFLPRPTPKPWLQVLPLYGMLSPGQTSEIKVRVCVEGREFRRQLEAKMEALEETLILRIENGRDYFVIVSGQYEPSCFGSSLEALVKQESREEGEDEMGAKIPTALWRIVDDLYRTGIQERDLFRRSGDIDTVRLDVCSFIFRYSK